MNKETLIQKLLNKKAENNNTIDLNAYALGLDAMYEAFQELKGEIDNKRCIGRLPLAFTIYNKAKILNRVEFIEWWKNRVSLSIGRKREEPQDQSGVS